MIFAVFAEYDRVTKEIERLKAALEDDTATLVTCSEPNLTQVSGTKDVAAGTAASSAAGPLPPHLPASKSVSVVGAATGNCVFFTQEHSCLNGKVTLFEVVKCFYHCLI